MPNSLLIEKLEGKSKKKSDTYEQKNLYFLLIADWTLVTWALIDSKKVIVLPNQLYYSCSPKVHAVALEPSISSRSMAFIQSTTYKPMILEK